MPSLMMNYRHILLHDFRTVKEGVVVNYNIGTSAHAPGTIAALRRHLPGNLKITLWAEAPLEPELAAMMKRRFPDVEILPNGLSDSSLGARLKSVDLFLVSSGSSISASTANALMSFRKETGKPAAAYAIGYSSDRRELIHAMDFCFFRDSSAVEKARSDGAAPLVSGFAPDAVFEFDAADELAGKRFLAEHHLVPGEYICCIPGLRYTPRWDFFPTPANPEKIRLNAENEEHDNAPLRKIIEKAVADFGLKVVICPEQIPELTLCKRLIYDKLPEAIQRKCVILPRMWSPDLALAVYQRSRCVCGMEMHSQVMAIGRGVPAVIFYHSGFGTKYTMWNDVGLGCWAVDADKPGYAQNAENAVLDILQNPSAAQDKVNHALDFIHQRSKEALLMAFAPAH